MYHPFPRFLRGLLHSSQSASGAVNTRTRRQHGLCRCFDGSTLAHNETNAALQQRLFPTRTPRSNIFYCNRQCIRIFHGRCHDTRVLHTPPRPTFSAHSLPATPQCAPAANDWEQPACCPAPPPSSATCCFPPTTLQSCAART